MNRLSTWGIAAHKALLHPSPALFEVASGSFNFNIYLTSDSLWIQTKAD